MFYTEIQKSILECKSTKKEHAADDKWCANGYAVNSHCDYGGSCKLSLREINNGKNSNSNFDFHLSLFKMKYYP